MLICGFKQSIALTRKTISKSHHYAIRNVRRAIRTEMANKRGSVNWYQPDFHMSEKSQTKRNFYCFPIKKDIRPFSAESSQFAIGERKESRAIKELVPSNNIWVIVKNSQCECDFFLSGMVTIASIWRASYKYDSPIFPIYSRSVVSHARSGWYMLFSRFHIRSNLISLTC